VHFSPVANEWRLSDVCRPFLAIRLETARAGPAQQTEPPSLIALAAQSGERER
jgi:hypothetical protein